MINFLLLFISLLQSLPNFLFTIWKLVLLFDFMVNLSINDFLIFLDNFSAFNPIFVRINLMNSSRL